MADETQAPKKSPDDELAYPREQLTRILDARNLALGPKDRETWMALVDTAFFASLHSEEGSPVRFSVAWMRGGASALAEEVDAAPVQLEGEVRLSWDVVAINPPRRFNPHEVRKLSKGLAFGRQALVVGGTAPDIRIEGFATLRPGTDGGTAALRFHVVGPGRIVFDAYNGEAFVLDRGVVAPRAAALEGIPVVWKALARIFASSRDPQGTTCLQVVPRLLQRMRNTGSGALFAVRGSAPSPQDLDGDLYRLSDPRFLSARVLTHARAQGEWMAALFAGGEDEPEHLRSRDAASDDLMQALDLLGRLSAIDGAILAGPEMDVYGVGHIIGSAWRQVRLPVIERRPEWEGDRPLPRAGARHDAACRFAEMHPDGLAFVISEDGPVRCAIHAGDHIDLWKVWMPQLDLY